MASDRMLPIRQRIISEVLTLATPFKTDSQQSRHLDCRLIFDLCFHPAIVQRMACIYGTDLLLGDRTLLIKVQRQLKSRGIKTATTGRLSR